MALPAYRGLLRATRIAFQGDERTLSAARLAIRDGFRSNAALSPVSTEAQAAVKHAEEVSVMLKQNVVQGKKDGDRYKLRIHEDTERGDNETIKFAGKSMKFEGSKGSKGSQTCCSA